MEDKSRLSIINDSNTEYFSNDSTLKQLGFEYQKLIALELCLSAEPNDQVWIECKGDVANSQKSIEVKHHIGEHALSSRSIDVWKTLANYIGEHPVVSSYEKLILHTTSSIPDNSIFFDWNKKSAIDKSNQLLEIQANTTIQNFYEKVHQADKETLRSILGRFSIVSDQPKIEEKWELLKQHSSFLTVPEKNRDSAIEVLIGYITKQAIDNSNKWNISIRDFRRDFRNIISKFVESETVFQYVAESAVDPYSDSQEYAFLEKMKHINLKLQIRENALSDYLRAQSSLIKMLRNEPTLKENIDIYDKDRERDIEDDKNRIMCELSDGDIKEKNTLKKSRQLYFEALGKPYGEIRGVTGTQKYYRDGRIHYVVDTSEFTWEIKENELNE